MVDGQPGAGKTTFVKRICYLWAERFQLSGDGKFGNLDEYSVILPIILKFITTENTLTDILASQLQCLNMSEICAVIRHIEENPKDTLLLLDGYDEYNGQSLIEKVILKKENPDLLCITTSRSHAIEQIKRHSSQAVQQHVRLCGFNEKQVKQYIEQFCQCHRLSTKTGEDLMITLKNSSNLFEVARIPIRTEMICVVWAVYGKLGNTFAELYEKFILHLITHWDKKMPTFSQFAEVTEEEIWNFNKPLLLKVGILANKWTKHNNLSSLFSNQELKDVLKEDYEKVINIGLLTKSYPSSATDVSMWSFPHLTFQEYFIAYLLGHDADDDHITVFVKRCKRHHYRVLHKCEMIFTFLNSKYPSKANKILTQLLLEEKDKIRCEELFDIICRQFQHIVNQACDIPLPYYLNIDSRKGMHLPVLQRLFEGDQRRKQSNLRKLSVDNPMKFKEFLEIVSINELKVTILNEQQLTLVSQKAKNLCHLTSLSINSTVGFSTTGQEDIMKNIQESKLKYLSVTGPGALEAVAENIARFTFLKQLQVEENSNAIKKSHGQKIIYALRGNKTMNQVAFRVMDLDDIIIKDNVKIEVAVHVKKLKNRTLKAISDSISSGSPVALHTLDLSRNSLEDQGTHLGELMGKLSGLQVLSLGDCNLKPKTIQEMVDALTKIRFQCHLRKLNMGHYENYNRNKLHSAGSALGKLIKHMPELQILDLEECKLTSTDFGAMSNALSGAFTKIHTLNLGVNDLGGAAEGGFLFLQHMPELKNLKAGGPSNDDPLPSICGAVDTGVLVKLSVLDVSDSSVESKKLANLSEHLHLMRCLEVLNLKGLDGVKMEDYKNIYKNIPPSLTHLNLSTDQAITKETVDPYDILDSKHRIGKLQRLNLTVTDSDLVMLQELLEEINPNIKVYSKAKENVWGMHVLDKTNSS